MDKSLLEIINDLVNRVNTHGCRVTIPYTEPSPLTVMFDGEFSGAEYIPTYPSTLHVFGINGHVSVSSIKSIECPSHNKYAVLFGGDSQVMDMMIRISE